MTFELWDTEHRNMNAAFATELEALHAVRRAADTHGTPVVFTMALVSEDETGEIQTLVMGDALIQRAGIRAA